MNILGSIITKIRRVLAYHGFLGTLKLCAIKGGRIIFWFSQAQRQRRAANQKVDSEFDRTWGVNTSGVSMPAKSEVVGSNWIHGTETQGCDSDTLHQVLNELDIDFSQFTFIDLGSGKGRAILMASRYPFKRVIGVEYSEQLNNIARQNLSLFPKDEICCEDIDVVCADASQTAIPEGPLLIFLYNPFGKPVMEAVVENVLSSFRQDQRRIIVVYFNASFFEAWQLDGVFKEKQLSESHWLFDTGVNEQAEVKV